MEIPWIDLELPKWSKRRICLETIIFCGNFTDLYIYDSISLGTRVIFQILYFSFNFQNGQNDQFVLKRSFSVKILLIYEFSTVYYLDIRVIFQILYFSSNYQNGQNYQFSMEILYIFTTVYL